MNPSNRQDLNNRAATPVIPTAIPVLTAHHLASERVTAHAHSLQYPVSAINKHTKKPLRTVPTSPINTRTQSGDRSFG